MWCNVVPCGVMSGDVMCRADVLWVLYAVWLCIVYGVCYVCCIVLYFKVKKSENV